RGRGAVSRRGWMSSADRVRALRAFTPPGCVGVVAIDGAVVGFVQCVAEGRNCAEGELPPLARVVRYRRWVDATAVLRAASSFDELPVGRVPGTLVQHVG